MTPQSSFMVLAPIDRRREAELRALLASMNRAPGRVDPNNELVPFARYEALHFARFLILDDLTLADGNLYGLPPFDPPLELAFLGELDGDADAFLVKLARDSELGLRAIFACCVGFDSGTNLARWMSAHTRRASATYVNRVGRTTRSIREEAALYDALEAHLDANGAALAGRSAADVHAALRTFVNGEIATGRLALSREQPTPPGWLLRKIADLIGVPLLLLIFSVPLAVAAIVLLLRIRMLEQTDPEYCPRPDRAHVELLTSIEDHDVTNQFSAMGTLKPGFARRTTCVGILFLLDFAQRHVYTRGRLARVRTIHFARWTFVDDENRRLLFTSSYDGSLDSYMDDFINKVAFGLNVVFSNGIGYPSSRWLVAGGAKDEQPYKNYIRRHELATQVWYNSHPGLT
ncbi:MAG: hypothetical protein QOD51_922, partial [Candidatus Eremiobacteraeota bacterium]|nr:hypothetical protein [Candidatus Eremiobacteraeota bacterium]